MTTAIWIIAIIEIIRVIEQSLQLRLLMKEAGARDNAYTEFVKSLKASDREFVRSMLEQFEKMDEAKGEPQTECEITDCDYHDACKERGQTDCAWK